MIRITRILTILTLVFGWASAASADTLMMPKRDGLKGTPLVVWGVSTQPNTVATTYSLDYGDGSPVATGNLSTTDRSYIAFQHTYATSGIFTATLTTINGATTEVATVALQIFDGTLLTADNLRSLKINMAIQDGLRWFWVNQENRAGNFPAGTTTQWPGGTWRTSYAALAALAFQNHGYTLPNNNTAPTGLYERFIVERALNYVVSGLTAITIGAEPAGNPCVGLATDPCVALAERRHDTFHEAYTTAVAALPLAASGALNRVVGAGVGGTYTAGRSFGEILQRMTNAIVWGQINTGVHRGGWYYNFNGSVFDGSTVGWDLLALLDAGAAGAVVPAFAKTEFAFTMNAGSLNTDGTLDYRGNGNAATADLAGPAKNGIGLQGLFFMGETTGPRVTAVTNAINSWWGGVSGTGGNSWGGCSNQNKGCGYTMFNNFKGLKLMGITTLPGVGRPRHPACKRLVCRLSGLAGQQPDVAEHPDRRQLGDDGLLVL
jgi:PKD domain